MTSRGGRCRHDTEAAQQCLEAAAGLLRLGIGLHCCNTRHRPKMGSSPRPPWPPSAACSLPLDEEEEDEGRLPATRRTACCIASASCRELSQIGVRHDGRREVPRLVPRYLQDVGPREGMAGGDWPILEIVGCPSFRDHTPCPKRQQHTSDPFVLDGCWLPHLSTMDGASSTPAVSLTYLVANLVRPGRAESDPWWAHA